MIIAIPPATPDTTVAADAPATEDVTMPPIPDISETPPITEAAIPIPVREMKGVLGQEVNPSTPEGKTTEEEQVLSLIHI